MWVKICGLTNLTDAHLAAAAGADALGFIFVRSSPRYLPHHSPDWHEWLPTLNRVRVAVVHQPDELPTQWQLFDALQWVVPHDTLPEPSMLRWLPELPLWIALRLPPQTTVTDVLSILHCWARHAERFILDTYHPTQLGGTGIVHDWQRAAALCSTAPKPTLLAGGLTPDNVTEAVRQVQPAGVDVSSGVESTVGRKDPDKVRAFVHAAKTALGGHNG